MKPVTGPDGDNPITDEQIRELRASAPPGSDIVRDCNWALERACCPSRARARCAAAYNARHGGES